MTNGEWGLATDRNGVSVFKRNVKGSQFQEFRGVADYDCSLSAFAALLLDVDNLVNWMYKTAEVKLLYQVSASERIAYMEFDFSPLPRRNMVVRNKITQDPHSKIVTCSMEHLPDHAVLIRNNRGRVRDLCGYIQAEPLGESKIRITYQSHVEPGLTLLAFKGVSSLVNKFIADTPYHTLSNARSELEKVQYKNAVIGFVSNF